MFKATARSFALACLAVCMTTSNLQDAAAATTPAGDESNETAPSEVKTGGVRMIPVKTSAGTFHVWTKQVGDNPKLKVLLLHGGPGFTHEYFEVFDSFFPKQDIEYIYYDQLGGGNSDQPKDDSLWTVPRFVDEVEQVRVALHLDSSNFCLYGQSWGGLLAMEYALKHQKNLKCLIISNMVDSIPQYNAYFKNVLEKQMDPKDLSEIKTFEKAGDTNSNRYNALIMRDFYEKHILRMPQAEWPEPLVRGMNHLNRHIYTLMQGPNELGASGRLEHWDRSADLGQITVPTLVIGAKYDTMDPAAMETMARKLPHGTYLYCPKGSHLALYDDQKTYFNGMIQFLRKFM